MAALLAFPPPLKLSEEELTRYFNYDDVNKLGQRRVGVKYRIVPVTLQFQYNNPGTFQNIVQVSVPMSDLRSRLIGLTFSGDVEFWRISATRNGREYLIGGGGTTQATSVHVQTLIGNPNATVYNQGVQADITAGSIATALERPNGRPYCFDPTPVFCGSDELVITGDLYNADTAGTATYYLNLVLHAWGFPNDGQVPQRPRGM